jgi:hypothetical protein
MNESRQLGDELELLVHRHMELCGLGGESGSRRAAPRLATSAAGKTEAECLADLAEMALVVYGGGGAGSDAAVASLKWALVEAIVRRS